MNAQSVLSKLEEEVQTGSIRKRVSESIDKRHIGELCNDVFTTLKPAATKLYGRELPDIAVGGLATWDLAAFVAADKDRTSYAIGVSIGAIRLFDISNCIRWGFGTPELPNSLSTEDLNQAWGAILYQYATHRYHDLRHWMLDPLIGSLIPYGISDLRMRSIVHPSLKYRQEVALYYLIAFILAHEIAHIMSGHLSNVTSRNVISLQSSVVNISALDLKWNTEFEADLLAVQTLLMLQESHKFEVLRQVAFFFNTLATIEMISTEPIFWGHSHPSPAERLAYVMKNLDHILTKSVLSSEAAKIREAIQSFAYLPEQLGEGILQDPRYYRKEAFLIIEDYEDYGGTLDQLHKSVALSNQGQELLKSGRLEDACTYFENALNTIKGCIYGEGFRIIYANLMEVNFRSRNLSKSIQWVVEGVNVAFEHGDRPMALYLVKGFQNLMESDKQSSIHQKSGGWFGRKQKASAESPSYKLDAQDLILLYSLRSKNDPRLTALVDSIIRLL
jgi:hypothetical protein